MNMKLLLLLLAAVVLVSGCATSTIESRKKERYNAYSELPAEQRAAVDAGQIKVGMPMDAVYVAWGKPHQVVKSVTAESEQTVWLYMDAQLQGYTYWGYRGYHGYRGRYYGGYYGPTLQYDYIPVGYVKAEVVFEQGVVKQWRTLPAPVF
jgi:outer membrane protein assembly factor BamE (lipoprotein component of BamABCDE complex)